jgi:uncharacterized membrane protein
MIWKSGCACPRLIGKERRNHMQPMKMFSGRWIGLGFVFLWFFIGGIAHFAATDLEMSAVPPYIPWPHAAVLISGAFELLGAVALLMGRTRRVAGVGLFLLTISVTPANIYMLQRADLFSVPHWVLVLRLPLQVGLLALIAWSTDVLAIQSKRNS